MLLERLSLLSSCAMCSSSHFPPELSLSQERQRNIRQFNAWISCTQGKIKFRLCLVLGRINYSDFLQYLSPHRVTQGIRHLPFDLVFIEHT